MLVRMLSGSASWQGRGQPLAQPVRDLSASVKREPLTRLSQSSHGTCVAPLTLHARAAAFFARRDHFRTLTLAPMSALQFIVEGGQHAVRHHPPVRQQERRAADRLRRAAHRAAGHPRERPAHPRRRDARRAHRDRSASTSSGRRATRSHIHAKTVQSGESRSRRSAARSARRSCSPGRCSRAAAQIELPPPGGDVIGRRRVDTHFLALEQLGATFELDDSFHLSTPGLARRGRLPRRAERHRRPRTRSPPPSPRRARRSSATRPASRTSRISATFSSRSARRSRASARTSSRSTAAGRSAARRIASAPITSRSARSSGSPPSTRSEIRIADAGVEHLRSTLHGLRAPRHRRARSTGADLVVPAEPGDGDPERPRRARPEARGSAVAGVPGRHDVDRARDGDAVRRA